MTSPPAVDRPVPPLISRERFFLRIAWSLLASFGMLGIALAMGALGYREFEHLSWLDATLNAAMLLGGEGPLHAPASTGGKVFATVYALFSGIVFVVVAGVVIAPLAHRFLHRFHMELADDDAAR